MKRRYALLSFVLAVSMAMLGACNYPGIATRQAQLPSEALRQTLAAYATHHPTSESPSILPIETAAPDGISATPVSHSPGLECGQLIEEGAFYQYCAQSGDTLEALKARFDVETEVILSEEQVPAEGYITPGQVLYLPNILASTLHGGILLPDSETIYSPTAADFDTQAYLQAVGGFLSTYSEQVDGERKSGAQIIQLVAEEFSVSPRLLLAFLEHRSGWVLGTPANPDRDYPIGFHASGQRGLYKELAMVGTHFTIGYYGWRSGVLTTLKFADGRQARLNPLINVGTAGVQNLFAKFYDPKDWFEVLYGSENFLGLYVLMFNDPWVRAASVEPMFYPGMEQPQMELPFLPGLRWSLTAGPHDSWRTGSPRGALDLAPVSGEPECQVSKHWATAVAPGVIVRSGRSAVVLDLDEDGFEGSGWTVLYFHLAEKDLILERSRVELDDPLGHPSCEGGRVTGRHMHIARKYNGEWIPADGPMPFVMGGWRAYADERNYYGELRKGDQVAVASPVGPRTSIVEREP